jgi:hypothetical protein
VLLGIVLALNAAIALLRRWRLERSDAAEALRGAAS